MSFRVKAEALRLKDTVTPEDREAFASLVGSIGQLEADSQALDTLVTALAPKVPDVDIRGMKNREAAKVLVEGLTVDQAKAETARRAQKTKRPGDE